MNKIFKCVCKKCGKNFQYVHPYGLRGKRKLCDKCRAARPTPKKRERKWEDPIDADAWDPVGASTPDAIRATQDRLIAAHQRRVREYCDHLIQRKRCRQLMDRPDDKPRRVVELRNGQIMEIRGSGIIGARASRGIMGFN